MSVFEKAHAMLAPPSQPPSAAPAAALENATVAAFALASQLGRTVPAVPTQTATNSPKSLPPGPQIKAAWGVTKYREGGLMNGIEHIMYRHAANSGFTKVSRFAAGTRARTIVGYVDDALRNGNVIAKGNGAFTIEHTFSSSIGTNATGKASSSLRVIVRNEIIQTAFPF